MADRNLMLDEFWSLSTFDERCKKYAELSDHDKFLVRLSMPPGPEVWIPCNDCVHRIAMKPACKAYPDGIPSDQINAVIEDQTIECGNGFRYMPKEEDDENRP